MRLTKEKLSAWVNALSSGKYHQHRGALHSKNGQSHCCLGVYQCLFPDVNRNFVTGELLSEKEIPGRIQTSLAALNDFGVPFEIIAGFIKENIQPSK